MMSNPNPAPTPVRSLLEPQLHSRLPNLRGTPMRDVFNTGYTFAFFVTQNRLTTNDLRAAVSL